MSRTQVYHATASTTVKPRKVPVETPTDEFGGHQTISPRSELLSPSTDRDRTHRSHHTSSKRRHKKHRSSRSHDHSTTSDASQRELLRIVLEQEAEADNLKKALRTTLERLDEESRKVAEYEKGNREAAEKLRDLNASRAAAEQEATRATQQLHVYEFQLQHAQKEISSTKDTLKVLEKQKEEAEELAARARARARKLLQKQMVFQAKEEGRRMGFEAGVRQAEEELTISTTARQALGQTLPSQSTSHGNHRRHRSSPSGAEEGTLPQPPVNDFREGDTHADERSDDGDPPAAEQTAYTEGDSSTLRTPVFPRAPLYPVHREESNQPSSQPPSQQHQQSYPQHPDPSRSPNVQVYSVDIPPPDQIQSHPSHRPSGWVTAQEHRDMYGSQTSHETPQHMPQPTVLQNAEAQPPERRRSQLPPPMPIFPVNVPVMQQAMHHQTPPKSAASSKKKMLRFPSFKDKAQSWYRSFSLRRKNKPVIDPIDEEPELLHAQQDGHTNGNGNPEQQMYSYHPEPPQSWYHEHRRNDDAKSQKSRAETTKGHSRAASMDDRLGGNRVSRASTRLSQLDLLSSAPQHHQGAGETMSVSGLSAHTNTKKLGSKLSTINEDSKRGFASPLAEVFSTSSRTAPVSFALPPQPPRSEGGRSRKRPPEISVPPPPGFSHNDPFVQGNFHVLPGGPPLAAKSSGITRSSSNSGPIGINVEPATAAVYSSQSPTAAPNSGNHLTPNYVYRPPPMSMRSPQKAPVDLSWDPVLPSNTSRKSRQSPPSQTHRQTQSYDAQPQGRTDDRSIRSGHSRAGSTAAHGLYSQDTTRMLTNQGGAQPQYQYHTPRAADPTYLTASPRAPSARSSGSRNAAGDGHAIRRVSSRGSMMSSYDPNTYIDPAFYAPDGSADPNLLHVGRAASPHRGLNRTPSLEYVDP